ncbi:hypothetical protein XENTR_v10007096 [Xenopus tropicalis]|nr:hypothetical protein XENTR_v10007096 [Xenopus tropicalis]
MEILQFNCKFRTIVVLTAQARENCIQWAFSVATISTFYERGIKECRFPWYRRLPLLTVCRPINTI